MQLHTIIFEKCIESIRKFHPNNRIIVCHTSTTQISQNILNYKNIICIVTPIDGSTVYGAISTLLKVENVNNYILLHDSMILLKPIDERILGKRFYFLWHFQAAYHDNKDNVINLICNNNFDYKNKCALLDKYQYQAGVTWVGVFGPAFGGNIEYLKKLWNVLNINDENLINYTGRDQLMSAERYISLVASQMKIIDYFPDTISLNGSIEFQPYKFQKLQYIDDIDIVINENYDSFFTKIWLMRN
jgi:hypothetical protein